jgi:hypothetical protein
MRKLQLLLLLLVPPWLLSDAVNAQGTAPEALYSRFRQFWIPFQAGPGRERLKQLQLFVSTDRGRTWRPAAIAAPDQDKFRFQAESDGLYWFAVQTMDLDGRYYPATLESAQPSLQVIVDTVPPNVLLRPQTPRPGEVGVSWELRDDYLDLLPDAFRLEWREVNGTMWRQLQRPPGATQVYWNPGTNAQIEVRLRVRDRAGNWGEATNTVSLIGGGGLPNDPPPIQGDPLGNKGAGQMPIAPPNRLLVNNKRIVLNYEVKDKGPSGISSLDLWFTQDGRNWYKLKSGDGPNLPTPYPVEVTQEGLYGFTLVAKSGVGIGERPPQVGDQPQVWVEVDLTKPIVQLHHVGVGEGVDKGKLSIQWSARDKNLGSKAIQISYAPKAGGGWTPVTPGKMENSGRYVWQMPELVPFEFLIKVEAIDEAGNVGEAVTQETIKVDLVQPKVRIKSVEPGK